MVVHKLRDMPSVVKTQCNVMNVFGNESGESNVTQTCALADYMYKDFYLLTAKN